ncbi:MAG TPA: ABC transporter permease [Gemmatimonadales bacterium]|nr:ABC transporter permease [Gemmatimonadales bacterium]
MNRRRLPWPLVAGVTIAFVLLHLPVLVLVAFSFNASRYSLAWTGFTLDWYRVLAERPAILQGVRASLVIGLVTTLVSTFLGTLLALGIHRLGKGAFRRNVEAALYLPVVTPEIVAGISILALFAALRIPLGLTTVIVAHITFCLPFVTIVVLARAAGMDRSLEEAAMMLGAPPATTFWRVTVPQLLPGIVAGALLAFTLSFDDFLITFFTAGPGSTTLPLVVYGMVRKAVEPTINAVSTIVLVVTTAALLVAEWMRKDQALPLSRQGEGAGG